MLNILKNYMIYIVIYHSYREERKLINVKNSFVICKMKKKYVVDIKSLKQALNHGLKLKKVHRIIKFNKKAWLKPHIDMNTELRKLAKDNFEKDLFKLMNNAVFGKTMENIRKHRNIELATAGKKEIN